LSNIAEYVRIKHIGNPHKHCRMGDERMSYASATQSETDRFNGAKNRRAYFNTKPDLHIWNSSGFS